MLERTTTRAIRAVTHLATELYSRLHFSAKIFSVCFPCALAPLPAILSKY